MHNMKKWSWKGTEIWVLKSRHMGAQILIGLAQTATASSCNGWVAYHFGELNGHVFHVFLSAKLSSRSHFDLGGSIVLVKTRQNLKQWPSRGWVWREKWFSCFDQGAVPSRLSKYGLKVFSQCWFLSIQVKHPLQLRERNHELTVVISKIPFGI